MSNNGTKETRRKYDEGFKQNALKMIDNGQTHELKVYGIDATGNPNTQLQGTPKNFNLPLPGQSPIGSLDVAANGSVLG